MKLSALGFILLTSSALPAAAGTPPVTPAIAASMKLIFQDDFSTRTIDTSKWQIGTDGRGREWGSDSYFVTKTDPQFSKTYGIAGGQLHIAATYDPAFVDPNKWGRHWYSGAISTVFSDGRKPSAVIRHGYVETRQRLPAGLGTWPGAWGNNLAYYRGDTTKGHVELDGYEHFGVTPTKISTTVHDWTDPSYPGRAASQSQAVNTKLPDLSAGFHTYGFLIYDTLLITYIDGVKVNQASIVQTSIDGFGWMFNLAMGGGWPITVPANGQYVMDIDYVRIYSAD